jgi:glycosyltransferase involved in cell wall biosynthesis
MRIGVDFCDLDPDYAGGVNSFAFGLLSGILATQQAADRIVLLTTARNHAFLRRKFGGAGVAFLMLPIGRLGRRIDSALILASWLTGCFKLRYWYDRVFRAATMHAIDEAVDVLLVPLTTMRFYGMTVPAILSIHDIQQEYHPEFFTWREKIARWAPYRLSAWRAGRVQASSDYIKNCLLEKFAFMTPQKIAVIPEGVDRGQFSPDAPKEKPAALGHLAGDDFVFYPAQIWPHKNHVLLVDALAQLRDRAGLELPCVLTGKDYGHWPAVAARIAARGLKQVHYLGRVPFPQLLWLYGNCRAVLALGLHESSSLPVREGAVFGKVLIATDIPPNCEVQEHLRVRLVGGADPTGLAQTLAAVARDEGGIVADTQENAILVRRFDWNVIAGEYYRVLQQLDKGG